MNSPRLRALRVASPTPSPGAIPAARRSRFRGVPGLAGAGANSLGRLLMVGVLGVVCMFASGCSTIANTPQVDMPATTPPPVATQPIAAPRAVTGSLFRTVSYRPLFEDRRARMVGDNVTIVIVENVSASQKVDIDDRQEERHRQRHQRGALPVGQLVRPRQRHRQLGAEFRGQGRHRKCQHLPGLDHRHRRRRAAQRTPGRDGREADRRQSERGRPALLGHDRPRVPSRPAARSVRRKSRTCASNRAAAGPSRNRRSCPGSTDSS